jgi:diguanylate cyclase (GGDEF)-like protein
VHATDALAEVDALRRSQRSLLVLTLVAVPLIALLAGALAFVLRKLRRRLDTAHAEELERLERAALTDNLTGIGNHRAFEAALERELQRAGATGTPLALAMFDLDGLKAVNGTGGHQAGDRMIRAVADALAAIARTSDGVFRVGGDEYAALLPGTTATGAFALAERVHHELGADASVSAGIAAVEGPVPTADRLIAAADAALFAAKDSGRGTVVYSDDVRPLGDPGAIIRRADRRAA